MSTSRQNVTGRWNSREIVYFRFGMLAIGLFVLPWSMVVLCTVRYWQSLQVPRADGFDLTEIVDLATALDEYAAEYGEYPPDFSSDDPKAEIDQHLARNFPRRDASADPPQNVNQLGPHNALYFWLRGFTNDPARPLTGSGWRNGWYPFHPSRLSLQDEYSPRSCRAPYIYFCGKTYKSAGFQGQPSWGTATPYLAQRPSKNSARLFIQPSRFQIIAAGNDGVYGTSQIAFLDAATSAGHTDNLGSFYREGPLGLEPFVVRQMQCRRSARMSVVVAVVCLALYPILLHLRSRVNGLDDLRQLVSRQAKAEMPSDAWYLRIMKQRQIRRQQTIDRLANRKSGEKRANQHDRTELSNNRDRAIFLAMLDDANATPNAALAGAAEKYKQQLD